MRLSALIGLLAIAVCANAADERQPAANVVRSTETAQVQNYAFHVMEPAAKAPRKFVFHQPSATVRAFPPIAKLAIPRPPVHVYGSADCYKMRTYQVKSDPDRWDVTRPSGYSECLAASKVVLKNADAQSTR